MIVPTALALFCSLLLGLAGPRVSRSLPGRTATALLAFAALVCALATGLVLCALAYIALAQWHPLAAIGHWSVTAVAAQDPVPVPTAIAGGIVAFALIGMSLAQAIVIGRDLLRSVRLCRELDSGTGSMVVLDSSDAQAYALVGRPSRVVVSRSMLRRLSSAERRTLLAHERSHIQRHHFGYAALSRLAAAGNPLLRPLVPAVDVAIERWADADAVAQVGDPGLVATTLAKVGLAQAGAVPAIGLAAATTAVRQRLESLHRSDNPARHALAALLIGLALCCAISSMAVGLHAHDIIEWAEIRARRR